MLELLKSNELTTDQRKKVSSLDELAEFEVNYRFLIPGIAKPLTYTMVRLKGLYYGADYAVVGASTSDSSNQSYGLLGRYY